MKALNIIETAYRATLEEQDDTIVWLTHAMTGAGASLAVLLRGNAVNYTVTSQDASGLRIGTAPQTQPPRLAHDLTRLMGKGVEVYVVEDDVAERGIDRQELIDGLRMVPRAGLPALFETFDYVWHW